MTKHVVDDLEPIQVQVVERQKFTGPPSFGDPLVEPSPQQRTVGQAGQGVLACQNGEILIGQKLPQRRPVDMRHGLQAGDGKRGNQKRLMTVGTTASARLPAQMIGRTDVRTTRPDP